MHVEKRSGYDWNVVFLDTDNSFIRGTIFGKNTAQEAAKDAHIDMSLPEECVLISLIRSDVV